MINQQSHIADTISKLILSIKPTASESFQDNIKQYSKKVLGSFISKPTSSNQNNPQQMKDKIMAKVSNNCDSKTTLQCQQSINRIMSNNVISKKGEVLKMMLKTSDQLNKGKDFSKIFNDSRATMANSSVISGNQSNHQLNHMAESALSNNNNISNNSYNFHKQSAHQYRRNANQGINQISINSRGSPQQGISQSDILKQITYILQNIDSRLISRSVATTGLSSTNSVTEGTPLSLSQGFVLNHNIQVTSPIRAMVAYICDIGWLFEKINKSLHERGSIQKSLALAVQEQLVEYYRWLAIMENEIKSEKLTLRKFVLWSYETMQRLKWLAIVLESVQPYRGCQILSVLNSFRPQGSQVINDLLNRLLHHLLQPLLQFVYNWTYKGELVDEHKEFFVHENKHRGRNGQGQFMNWADKYSLLQANIPDILDRESALMIFNAGKTLHFLKSQCGCGYSVNVPFIDPAHILSRETGQSLSILAPAFKKWLKLVYQELSRKLVSVLTKDFNLRFHLQSVKLFFLCGKGDFIQNLIDALKEQMDKPKHLIYEHTLDGYISDARDKCFTDFKLTSLEGKQMLMKEGEQIVSTKNKYFKDPSYKSNIINRLLAKKIDYGDSSWDSFNFQYAMDRIQPLSCILTPQSFLNYQKIFHLLWRVKRVEQILKDVWLMHLKDYPKRTHSKDIRLLSKVFHRCHLLRSNMAHFLTNFYGYLMIAMEARWDVFYKEIDPAPHVDAIIRQHERLQHDLLDLTLNTPVKKPLLDCLLRIFAVIEQFKSLELQVKEQYEEFFERMRQFENRQKILLKGVINLEEGEELQMPEFDQTHLRKRLTDIQEVYEKTFMGFLAILEKQQNQDINVLAFRLDFSEYFTGNYIVVQEDNEFIKH